jgi:hypothetical protein
MTGRGRAHHEPAELSRSLNGARANVPSTRAVDA